MMNVICGRKKKDIDMCGGEYLMLSKNCYL